MSRGHATVTLPAVVSAGLGCWPLSGLHDSLGVQKMTPGSNPIGPPKPPKETPTMAPGPTSRPRGGVEKGSTKRGSPFLCLSHRGASFEDPALPPCLKANLNNIFVFALSRLGQVVNSLTASLYDSDVGPRASPLRNNPTKTIASQTLRLRGLGKKRQKKTSQERSCEKEGPVYFQPWVLKL